MSGPFSKNSSLLKPPPNNTRRSFYRSSTWYRTKGKRRVTPNPYTMYEAKSTTSVPANCTDTGDAPNTYAGTWVAQASPSLDPLASNKALERFKNAAMGGTDAQLATTLAEWKQSEKMIVARCGQLVRAYKKLRIWDLPGVAKELGINPTEKSRRRLDVHRRKRDVANAWLEYHFGWAPLMQDIASAVDVLQAPVPSSKYKGRATARGSFRESKGNYEWQTAADASVSCQLTAEVYIDSPNVALANRMGFINPASVAWELVPFSFLVDWFLPIGDFLNSFSDFLGYRIVSPWTTTLRRCKSEQLYKQPAPSLWQCQLGEAVYMTRAAGMPPYKLRLKSFKGFSPTRGATAVALVVQLFAPKSR